LLNYGKIVKKAGHYVFKSLSAAAFFVFHLGKKLSKLPLSMVYSQLV